MSVVNNIHFDGAMAATRTGSSDLAYATAGRLADLIRRGELSAVELLEMQLDRIGRLNPALNAIATLDVDGARRAATAADRARAAGEALGPLHGVALTLKDSHAVAGVRSTVGVAAAGDRVPETDGTVAARLRAAGAIILGKTNLDSWLYDFQTNSELFGRANNPWDLARTPGGSSGGAAAAVAAGLVPAEVGSDLGGSVRVPAAFCGLVGFKPTEGRIPETGHIDLGRPRSVWIMESIGPLARSVDDVRLLYTILAGPDGADPSVPPVPVRNEGIARLGGLRVALSTAFPGQRVQAATRAAVRSVGEALERAGAVVEEAFPAFEWETYVEVRRRLFEMTDDPFGPAAAGRAVKLAEYFTALEARSAAIGLWEAFFDEWDVLLSPTVNRTAFEHRPTETPFDVDGVETEYWSVGRHTQPMNFFGAPAIALPAGAGPDGLPLSIQLSARRWADDRLLAIAAAVEPLAGGFRPPPPPFGG
jgi:amidase